MITDKDNGFKALQERMRSLQNDNWVITVGVHGKELHKDSKLTVAQVALFHEFGTSTIPKRSFIGAWFDAHGKELAKKSVKDVQGFLKGTLTRVQVLARAGSRAVAGIQARISQGIPPPLKPATIKRKGSSVPLIDTGQLRTSITWAEAKEDE